jgi:hypothetical protein
MNKEFKVKIDYTDDISVTRTADPNDGWDADDFRHDYTINGYRLADDKSREWDFIFDKDPEGKTLYFVYALYDTGDSFHRENNVMCEIGLYEHEKDAETVMYALEQDYKKNPDGFDVMEVALPIGGVIQKIAASTWKGHFERLRSINIEPVSPVGKRKVEF